MIAEGTHPSRVPPLRHVPCLKEEIPMSSKLYTFQDAMEAYRQHLIRNPGKALDTGSGIAALLDYRGDVYGAVLDGPTGMIDRRCAFDFNERTFRDGHWEGQTAEQTAVSIQSPRLIDISLF